MSTRGDIGRIWDFFISYTQADRAWAEWIAWVLEEDGQRVLVQAWDFVPGSNWIQGMQAGVRDAARTIAVLSDAYLESVYGSAEWQAAWSSDPHGTERRLLPLRVTACDRPGLLRGLVGVDLFGITESAARERLRKTVTATVTGRDKPSVAPGFPGAGRAMPDEPGFPGGTATDAYLQSAEYSGHSLAADPLRGTGLPTASIVPAQGGVLRWRRQTGGSVSSSPVVYHGTVYVGSDDHCLWAVDAETGQERWRCKTGGRVSSSPVVDDGTVYVGSDDHCLWAVDAETGRERWRYETAGRVSSSPVVDDGTVIVGGDDEHLRAVDAETGEARWEERYLGRCWSLSTVENGKVYVGADDRGMTAVDAADGGWHWRVSTGNAVRSSPAVHDRMVFFGCDDHLLWAANVDTGKARWKLKTGGMVRSSPVVHDGVVYVGSDDQCLWAADASSGRALGNLKTGGMVRSSPAVHDGVVYVGSDDYYIRAMDAITTSRSRWRAKTTPGQELWRLRTGGMVRSSPVVHDRTVYVGSDDGFLYAVWA